MNRINQKLQEEKKLLSIYFTAGFPKLNDTVTIISQLENSGVDFIEIGLPFSDPLADGPTIQNSSTTALANGMTSEILFDQLKDIRKSVSIPLIIMGYFNPMMQYGVEAFCKKCEETGIDGLIIPDLPVKEYNQHYKSIFEKYNSNLNTNNEDILLFCNKEVMLLFMKLIKNRSEKFNIKKENIEPGSCFKIDINIEYESSNEFKYHYLSFEKIYPTKFNYEPLNKREMGGTKSFR